MATKSKKQASSSSASATSTTTIDVSSEPATSTPTHQRPVSPARLSRIQERNELQHLNDRLASYIDKVRNLENENSKLKVQIQKTSQSREIHSIKELYESELGDTRNSLDAIAKEKAQLELLLSRAQEDLKSFENRYNKKVSENANLGKKIISIETQVEDLKNRINQGVAERKKLEGDVRQVNDDNKTLEDKLKSLKKQLEEETILRVDLENRNQSLNEELQFQRQLYNKELEEVRSKEYEIKETYSESLKQQYEQQLASELKELRADTENRIAYYRQEMEDKYEVQIGALQDEIERKNVSINASNLKIKQLNSTYNFVHTEIDQLKSENQNLKDKVSDLNKLVEQEREWSKAAIDRKEEEINELKDKLDALLEEYKDLVDEKIKIDAELAVYRKLLEGEETRLNISPQVSTSSIITAASTPYSSKSFIPRGNKRKRICLQEEENLVDLAVTSNAKGEIEISDHDQDGKFVKLYNKSDKEISLGGWQLLRTTDDLETRYKFHRSIVIKPESTITVWSSDANAFHSPPNDIVMKAQTWFTADTMTTTLFNMNSEEVASRKTEKRVTSYSQRLSQGYLNSESEVDGQQKCLIM